MTKHLADEVQRRHFITNPNAKPRMIKSKTKADLKKILIEDRITTTADVQFLLRKEEAFRARIIEAEKEKEAINASNADNQSTARSNDWIGMLPWLRLGHVIIHEEVIELYKEKDAWEGCLGSDGRNSEERPDDWTAVAARVYNSSEYVFDTLVLTYLHHEFAESI